MDNLNFIDKVGNIYASWGLLIIYSGSLIETLPIGFLIPGGLIIALGGFYSISENLSLSKVILTGTLGMLTAFLIGYISGRNTGDLFIKKFKQEKNAEVAKNLLEKQGPVILTTSLLGNLTRFWISYIAGVHKYNIFKFFFYAMVASLTWNSLFVSIGFLAGGERDKLESGIAKLGILSYGLVIIALITLYLNIKREFKAVKGK